MLSDDLAPDNGQVKPNGKIDSQMQLQITPIDIRLQIFNLTSGG